MERIEIKIDTNMHDMKRFAMWRLFHCRLYWIFCAITIVVACAILLTRRDVYANKEYQGIILVTLVVIGLPISAVLGMVRHAYRQVKDLQTRLVRFEEEGIRIINDGTEVLYRWHEGMRTTETNKYFYATAGRRPLFVLCKYRLQEATMDNVKALINQKMSRTSRSIEQG